MILTDNISNGAGPLFVTDQNCHWYTPDGRGCHTVPYADKKREGGRPVTLTDARKMSLLPSVTTLLRILEKPALTNWRCEQAVLAALTLPRHEDESLSEFAKRAARDSEEVKDSAANFGTAIHRALEQYLVEFGPPMVSPELEPFMLPIYGWIEENIVDVVCAEKTVVNQELGYAGCLDLIAQHKVHGPCFIDFKTQDTKGKARFYDEWPLQLAAYKLAQEQPMSPLTTDAKLISVVIDSKTPQSPVERVWSADEERDATEAFRLVVRLWQLRKGYVPQLATT